MSLGLEDLLVGVLVAASALYSCWRLLSVRLRLRVLDVLQPALGPVAGGGLQKLRSRNLARLAGGCSACSAAPKGLRVMKR
jgi:hypothetical protein